MLTFATDFKTSTTMTKYLYVLDCVTPAIWQKEFSVTNPEEEYYSNLEEGDFEDMDESEKAEEVMDYYGLHLEGCHYMITDKPIPLKELTD